MRSRIPAIAFFSFIANSSLLANIEPPKSFSDLRGAVVSNISTVSDFELKTGEFLNCEPLPKKNKKITTSLRCQIKDSSFKVERLNQEPLLIEMDNLIYFEHNNKKKSKIPSIVSSYYFHGTWSIKGKQTLLSVCVNVFSDGKLHAHLTSRDLNITEQMVIVP